MSAVPTSAVPSGEAQVLRANRQMGLAARKVRDLATVAALLCEAPLAVICLADTEVVRSDSLEATDTGALPDYAQLNPLSLAALAPLEIADLASDPRTAPATGFYFGIPLIGADGEVFGILAILDRVARVLNPTQRTALGALARNLTGQIAACAELAFVRAVTDSSPVAVYITDAKGNLRYVNPAYRKVFNFAPTQSIDEWLAAVHPDDQHRQEAEWADFRRNPRPIRLDYRTALPDGQSRHYTEQVVSVAGSRAFLGTITEVTELVAARNELRRAETLFQHTCEQAPIGIAYADREGRLTRSNQAFAQLLGYRAGELDARSVIDLTYAEDRTRAAAELELLWNGGIPSVDLEKRYHRRDGTVVWIDTTTTLVRAADGTPACAVEFVRDISVRKAMEAALQQQQSLLEAVITNLPIALLACDAAGNITRYNHAAEALFSMPPASESCAGTRSGYPLAASVFLPDGVTPVPPPDRPLARTLRGEVITDLELVVVPVGLAPRTTVTTARRLIDVDGRTLGAVSVISDVTERRFAELELERVNRQLIDASRQAGMAEVATNVLHNVGNVLNGVTVSASLLADRLKTGRHTGLARVAAMLEEHAADLAAFVSVDARGRQLPHYLAQLASQLQSDQQGAAEELAALRTHVEHIKQAVTMQQSYARRFGVSETVSVAALIDDCLRLTAGALTRQGVVVQCDLDELPAITIDRHKALQILVNLVRNATQACEESPNARKLITVRATSHAGRLRIAVSDTGVGIAPETMARLFSHGFTTRVSGHGFGLHSGALTARELGGNLTADSDGLGCGATFTLELPLEAPRA